VGAFHSIGIVGVYRSTCVEATIGPSHKGHSASGGRGNSANRFCPLRCISRTRTFAGCRSRKSIVEGHRPSEYEVNDTLAALTKSSGGLIGQFVASRLIEPAPPQPTEEDLDLDARKRERREELRSSCPFFVNCASHGFLTTAHNVSVRAEVLYRARCTYSSWG
jgi:hypothetical protein